MIYSAQIDALAVPATPNSDDPLGQRSYLALKVQVAHDPDVTDIAAMVDELLPKIRAKLLAAFGETAP